MRKQFKPYEFDEMRRFVILRTCYHKTAAADTFDAFRYEENYDEILAWIERLGGEII